MNFAPAENIVNAVLYEGYILYPYRPSSVKNRQRWTFGGVYPQSFCEKQGGSDAWSMQTECLVRRPHEQIDLPLLHVKVRFLHLLSREIRELTGMRNVEFGMRNEDDQGSGVRGQGLGDHGMRNKAEGGDIPNSAVPGDAELENASRLVAFLQVGDRLYQSWQEAVEREVDLPNIRPDDLVAGSMQLRFSFPASRDLQPLTSPTGEKVGLIVRKQQKIEGSVKLGAERIDDDLCRIRVEISNLTPWDERDPSTTRDDALMRSLVSTHTMLGVENGEFISLLDPPQEYSDSVAACSNVGTWPVLVGETGEHDIMLSSPIILYDYPQIAPESPGNLYDGTEIDEILTLRIMTLTEDERREMVAVDERARALLDRTDALTGDDLMKLHGVVRNLQVKQGGTQDG